MTAPILYNSHKYPNITLDKVECDIISSSSKPINVFWVNLISLKHRENWPHNRWYPSRSKKSSTGVFVTYQSDLTPLPTLGTPGDLWVTPDDLYIKALDLSWTVWKRSIEFRCPYDEDRLLTWSSNAHFKYLGEETVRTEAQKWKNEGVPICYIPTHARSSLSISAALAKSFKELTERDCVLLLNAQLNHIRQPFGQGLPSSRDDHGPIGGLFVQPSNERSHEATEELSGLQSNTPDDFRRASDHPMSEPDKVYCKPSHQPTYKPFPVDRYRTPVDHHESSGFLRCHNDMEVFLPPTEAGPDEEENSHIVICKWLLSGSDATEPPPIDPDRVRSLPIVTVLEAPPPSSPQSDFEAHDERVKKILSMGGSVVVTESEPNIPTYSWDEQSLSSVTRRQVDGALLQWQSAKLTEKLLREDRDHETVKGPLRKFMEAELDPRDSVNCLDIPTFGGEIPRLIRAIATSSRAISGTAGVTFRKKLPKRSRRSGVQKTRRGASNCNANARPTRQCKKRQCSPVDPLPKRSKKDNIAVDANGSPTRDELANSGEHIQSTSMPSTAKKNRGLAEILKDVFIEISASGVREIEWDIVRTISWILITSSGAITPPHHDASGFLTYARADMGVKLWALVVSKETSDSVEQSMQNFHRLVESCGDIAELEKIANVATIFLPRGAMLLQPPGAVHGVYTLERSIFTCGHFYTLDAMHLTEVVRACAAYNGQEGTNASHPGSIRMLSRIALSLVYDWHQSVLRKPFISLARMLIWEHIYAPGDIDPYDTEFKHSAESKGELAAAQAVVEAILEHNNIFLDDIQPAPLKDFAWLSTIGQGEDWTDWRDPGTKTIVIPDMRSYFGAFDGAEM